jgi:hypothetical protein
MMLTFLIAINSQTFCINFITIIKHNKRVAQEEEQQQLSVPGALSLEYSVFRILSFVPASFLFPPLSKATHKTYEFG